MPRQQDHEPPRQRLPTEHMNAEGRGHSSLLSTRAFEGTQRSPVGPRAGSDNQVVLLFSCHGGTGSTTLATTLGTLLAWSDRSACLLDIDLQFGDVLTALNLEGTFPISEVICELDTFDPDRVMARLPRHRSGLCVLSQVGHIQGLSSLSHQSLSQMITAIRSTFDVLIIDGVRDFNDYALAACDAADTVLMVASQDLPTLKGLRMRLELFEQLGYDPRLIRVVLNRYSRRSPVRLATIKSLLEVNLDFVIRNDFKSVHRALEQGKTLMETATRARVTRDIRALYDALFAPGAEKGRKR
jgi:pilus assembly protein CpaE